MEEKRAKTLDALSTFIQSQRDLLARTQSDIARLRELRDEIAASFPDCPDGTGDKLKESSARLSQNMDCMPPLPEDIDWSVFGACDPTPLKELAASHRQTYARRNEPSTTQRSELSELQKLVKRSRLLMLDPVLASYSYLADLSSDEEDAPDPEELRRAHEREKIRELKKRRLDIALPTLGGLRRPRGTAGVFIRQDQADESAEVDISLDGEGEGGRDPSTLASGSDAVPMDVDTPPTSVASPASAVSGLPPALPPSRKKSSRERRPTHKAQMGSISASSHSKPKGGGDLEARVPDAHVEPDPSSAAPQKEKGKPKSETYKQAWSVSEQHLLERLLEEIPEGEKNRWSKISQAMNGRRTARQVASRVQKYFEKLKRFGLDVKS